MRAVKKHEEENHFYGIPLKYVSLVVLTVQNTAAIIVMRYTRATPSESSYLTTTAVIMGEVMKVVASTFLLWRSDDALRTVMSSPGELLKTGVPAFLYLIQNNLQYVAVSNLPAATYQVAYQLKIISTAIMSVVLLNRRLSSQKWLALFLLTVGVAVVQLSAMPAKGSHPPNVNLSLGLAATLAACLCSGLAGVYFEKILKTSRVSLWARNIQLGLISIFIGMCGIYFDPHQYEVLIDGGFFQGYTILTFVNITVQGCGGLIIAVVIKYADNILKNFATSMSIILSATISWIYMGFDLTVMFLVGVLIVNYSAYMYGKKDTVVILEEPEDEGELMEDHKKTLEP